MADDISVLTKSIEATDHFIENVIEFLKKDSDPLENYECICYELAHSKAALEIAKSLTELDLSNEKNLLLACGFAADAVWQISSYFITYDHFHTELIKLLQTSKDLISKFKDPAFVYLLKDYQFDSALEPEFQLVADTFRKFGESQIKPYAEQVHRQNLDVPEEVINKLSELGGFGLSIPEKYGGFAIEGSNEYLSMVIATEELSKASLAIGGSLITRPEILARALLTGGTESQKSYWLPKIASGELMVAVAVTEPDYGSDVANLTTTATRLENGWVINGVKTWCTFGARADILMLLARSDPDKDKAHKGLSLFIVPKDRANGKGFLLTQSSDTPGRPVSLEPGKMEGRPIDTIGYRGMHSYEIAFENWWVPHENLVGEDSGVNKGFYLQMKGFENGRLQTAARALGVMQAAYQSGLSYANSRNVFGKPIINYQLVGQKLGRMNLLINASRYFTYKVAKMMSQGLGSMEASLVKAYVCKAAEWVTREAMQIHGGMGYAEEFPVSRYFVDARVLSIFEGADETLSIKVIAKNLLSALN
jgi:(2S)-methylsuccinyl-CoA dehydrogenase